MKLISKTTLKALVVVFALVCSTNAFAGYGNNITIWDGIGTKPSSGSGEDNEAEPIMVQSQVWDLEAFMLKGKALTVVGGFNFYTGQSDGSKTLTMGDIFIDLNRDAIVSPNTISGYDYNPGYKMVTNDLFKYDYVLHIDWANGQYKIVKLNDRSVLEDTEYGAAWNKPSNPWKYVSGGDEGTTGSFNTYGKASQNDTGMLGWDGNNNHSVATFDLGSIDLSNGALFKTTMECGNDNMLGAAPVPEPSTFALLGVGLLGAGLLRRRNRK